MTPQPKPSRLSRLRQWAIDVLYNFDRLIATIFGAPPQETISSEIGRHVTNPIVEEAEDVLDWLQKDHIKNAIDHADKLERP